MTTLLEVFIQKLHVIGGARVKAGKCHSVGARADIQLGAILSGRIRKLALNHSAYRRVGDAPTDFTTIDD